MAEGTTDPCQIFLDAIAADMVLIDPIMQRIAFNSQQYADCISNNPPPEPGMVFQDTASIIAAAKTSSNHGLRAMIAKRMRESVDRLGKHVRHYVAHCEAAIDILKGI